MNHDYQWRALRSYRRIMDLHPIAVGIAILHSLIDIIIGRFDTANACQNQNPAENQLANIHVIFLLQLVRIVCCCFNKLLTARVKSPDQLSSINFL
jgi:hypothetical protein